MQKSIDLSTQAAPCGSMERSSPRQYIYMGAFQTDGPQFMDIIGHSE